VNPRRVPDYDEGVTEKGTWVNVAPREEALDNETKWSDGGVVRKNDERRREPLLISIDSIYSKKKKEKGILLPFLF
jgi:hypothetical protein